MRLSRPSPAMVIALLALFVSLGGTGIAAKKVLIDGKSIKKGSIPGDRLQRNSVVPKGYAMVLVPQSGAKETSARAAQTSTDFDYSTRRNPSVRYVQCPSNGSLVSGQLIPVDNALAVKNLLPSGALNIPAVCGQYLKAKYPDYDPASWSIVKIVNTAQTVDQNTKDIQQTKQDVSQVYDVLDASAIGVLTNRITVPAGIPGVPTQPLFAPLTGVATASPDFGSAQNAVPNATNVFKDISVKLVRAPTSGSLNQLTVSMVINDGTQHGISGSCSFNPQTATGCTISEALRVPKGSTAAWLIIPAGPLPPGPPVPTWSDFDVSIGYTGSPL